MLIYFSVAIPLHEMRRMWADIQFVVTGAEPYPFRGGFPTHEEVLADNLQGLLRNFYLSVYGDAVEGFSDESRSVTTYGNAVICRETFSSSRGRSDRSAFILFKDEDGHLRPAKVKTK
jgi:hypothetical protein